MDAREARGRLALCAWCVGEVHGRKRETGKLEHRLADAASVGQPTLLAVHELACGALCRGAITGLELAVEDHCAETGLDRAYPGAGLAIEEGDQVVAGEGAFGPELVCLFALDAEAGCFEC